MRATPCCTVSFVLACTSALELWLGAVVRAADEIRQAHTDPLWIGFARLEYDRTHESVAIECDQLAAQTRALLDSVRQAEIVNGANVATGAQLGTWGVIT